MIILYDEIRKNIKFSFGQYMFFSEQFDRIFLLYEIYNKFRI